MRKIDLFVIGFKRIACDWQNGKANDYYFCLQLAQHYTLLSQEVKSEVKNDIWTVCIEDTNIVFRDIDDLKNHIEHIKKHIEL